MSRYDDIRDRAAAVARDPEFLWPLGRDICIDDVPFLLALVATYRAALEIIEPSE